MTKTTKNAATHQGTCQLCGRLQMLPKGLLAKHGYDVQWGYFNGVCSGSDHQPYELSKDLIESYLPTARKTLVDLKAAPAAIRAAEPKTDGVCYSVAIEFKTVLLVGKLVEHVSKSKFEKGTDFVATHRGEEVRRYLSSEDVATVAIEFREKAAKRAEERAAQYATWVKFLEERKANWKLTPENLVPVTEESRAATLHGVNAYWLKKTGKTEALCGSGSRFSGRSTYKATTNDESKITCKACLKAIAEKKASEVVSAKAKTIVDDMIAKHGEKVLVSYSDESFAAIKEIRYQRKDLDKEVRAAAIRQIERGGK